MKPRTMSKSIKNKVWRVGKDDVGRPILQWKADEIAATDHTPDTADPLGRTFNMLKCLEVPGLTLANEVESNVDGRNPYDNDLD
jgi:hypothetical protein